MDIRPALPADRSAIWAIIEPVIRAGETYALDRTLTEAEAIGYWTGADRESFVATDGGTIVGTCYLRANQPGGGRHIANAGFITAAGATGRGVARAMAGHVLEQARARGYRGMQFNFVVGSNARAIALWQSLGFAIVGRLPLAFDHPRLGCTDALVMFRPL